jgi:hypothetical protein
MPNSYTGPDSPEPFIDPTDQLVLVDLISAFHEFHEAAVERDERERDGVVEIGAPTDFMESSPFVIDYPEEDENAPVPYAQMKWLPRNELTAPAKKILVRIPNMSMGADFMPPKGKKYWNDVFIQIDSARYLLNSEGITAYPDSESLDDSGEHGDDSGDFWTVELLDWTVPPITPTQLQQLLKGFRMRRQPNNE